MKFSAGFFVFAFAAIQLAGALPSQATDNAIADPLQKRSGDAEQPYYGGDGDDDDDDRRYYHHHHHYHPPPPRPRPPPPPPPPRPPPPPPPRPPPRPPPPPPPRPPPPPPPRPPPPPPPNPCVEAAKHLVNLYRSWNGLVTDHFYTTNAQEWGNAVRAGWGQEGIAARIFNIQVPHSVPLYRLWNPGWGDHFYTTNAAERQNAIRALGFHDEGIAGYVYTGATCGAKPLYRMFQGVWRTGNRYSPVRIYGIPIPTADHFYTTNPAERTNAINNLQYADEGIAAYVL